MGASVPTAAAILEQLSQKGVRLLSVLALCRMPDYVPVWYESPKLFQRFARLLLKQGHPTLALEVAARGLADKAYPNDLELMYCRALALVNSGNPTRADFFVQELLARGDSVVLGPQRCALSRRANPQGRGGPGRRFRKSPLELAARTFFGFYLEAFVLTERKDTFPGINAAALALLTGDIDLFCGRIASEVRSLILAELEGEHDQN